MDDGVYTSNFRPGLVAFLADTVISNPGPEA
jgi:hypothetical protein